MFQKNRSLKQAALVVVIFVLTAGVLFGGESLLKRFFERNPLAQRAESIKEIKKYELREESDGLYLSLHMDEVDNLRETLEPFIREIQEIKHKKVSRIEVITPGSEDLKEVYYELSFPLEEARVSGSYSELLTSLRTLEEKYQGEFRIYIGDEFFYIQLEKEDKLFYSVTPRYASVVTALKGGGA